jgi:hypothetical protein
VALSMSPQDTSDLADRAEVCGCDICALKLDFTIDAHLLGEIEKHNAVIFAGSGISTETGFTHPDTLYETLKYETKIQDNLEFWELVDRFESQPNGRQKFVELVKGRFSYIDSFRDLRWSATRFHRALGNAPYFRTIITTNWDRYFEDIIDATPFVYDSDIPFWESAKRPLLKIHGSIDNYSSIVASTEDYSSCEKRLREGALGAVLKQIFATRTCIFCGYSAKDKDFRRIFHTIKEGLGQFARAHYLVSPFVSDGEAEELQRELGVIAIRTDAAHFINTIKDHMREKFCFASDSSFDEISEELERFREVHHDFVGSYNPREMPHLIFATAYQDGVLHAFERIVDRAMTGEFSDLHDVQNRIAGYERKIVGYRRRKNYWDVAYFTGYQNGLLEFVLLNEKADEEPPAIPECFHPGLGELYLEEFNEQVRENPECHKGAFREAQRRTAKFSGDEDVVVQHLPWG